MQTLEVDGTAKNEYNVPGFYYQYLITDALKDEIEFRVRVYTWCLSKTSESYVKWLQDEYKRNLKAGLFMNNLKRNKNIEQDDLDIQAENGPEIDGDS